MKEKATQAEHATNQGEMSTVYKITKELNGIRAKHQTLSWIRMESLSHLTEIKQQDGCNTSRMF